MNNTATATIAYESFMFPECEFSKVHKCSTLSLSLIVSLTKNIWKSEPEFRYFDENTASLDDFYKETKNNSTLYGSIRGDNVLTSASFYYVKPERLQHYDFSHPIQRETLKFYFKKFGADQLKLNDFTPLLNLLLPFQIQSWIAFCIIYSCLKLISNCCNRSRPQWDTKLLSVWVGVQLVISLRVYRVNLTSLLTSPSPPAPLFDSIDGLSLAIKDNAVKLIVRYTDDFGYVNIIRATDEPLISLKNALQTNPAIVLSNLKEICELIHSNERLVFLSYDADVLAICDLTCLDSMEFPSPSLLAAYIFKKHAAYLEKFNTYVPFLQNLAQIESVRRRPITGTCEPPKRSWDEDMARIFQFQVTFSALLFLCISYSCASMVFFIEIYAKRRN